LVMASFATSFGTFTCSVNPVDKRPYQNCINTIAAYCQTSSPLFLTLGKLSPEDHRCEAVPWRDLENMD
jgi:hypothetical protein